MLSPMIADQRTAKAIANQQQAINAALAALPHINSEEIETEVDLSGSCDPQREDPHYRTWVIEVRPHSEIGMEIFVNGVDVDPGGDAVHLPKEEAMQWAKEWCKQAHNDLKHLNEYKFYQRYQGDIADMILDKK